MSRILLDVHPPSSYEFSSSLDLELGWKSAGLMERLRSVPMVPRLISIRGTCDQRCTISTILINGPSNVDRLLVTISFRQGSVLMLSEKAPVNIVKIPVEISILVFSQSHCNFIFSSGYLLPIKGRHSQSQPTAHGSYSR